MDELERRLRTYWPVGPPLELRERVLNTQRTRPWDWLPAAVAAALAITFANFGANLHKQLAEQASAVRAVDEPGGPPEFAALTDLFR